MKDAVKDMWSSVLLFAPKLVAFLLILIIGVIIAKVIAKAVDKILERIGFDRAVERGGVKRALAGSHYDASAIAGKIVYYALVLFVLQLAFGVFGPNPISVLIAGVIAFLPKLFVALIIVVVASAIAAAVRDLLSNTLSGLSYGRMLATLASVFILGLGVIAALNQVGVAVTVTLPVLVTVLATLGGILIVGVGGGLIKPMQQRWDRYLDTAEQESRTIRDHTTSPETTTRPASPQQQAYSAQGTQPPNPGHQQPDDQPDPYGQQPTPAVSAPDYPPSACQPHGDQLPPSPTY